MGSQAIFAMKSVDGGPTGGASAFYSVEDYNQLLLTVTIAADASFEDIADAINALDAPLSAEFGIFDVSTAGISFGVQAGNGTDGQGQGQFYNGVKLSVFPVVERIRSRRS